MSEMRRIQEAREVEENSDIDFILDVITKTQGFGNTDRVITDAFEIQTSSKYGTIIKDIIIRLNERKRLRGKFIAQGIVRVIGSENIRTYFAKTMSISGS